MAVLKKVKLYYVNLAEKNGMSNKFQVNIGNLTPEHIKQIEDMGISVNEPRVDSDPKKDKSEQGHYIVAKSSFPVRVIDGDKNIVPVDDLRTMGNGTVANVQINAYEWELAKQKKRGVSAGLQQIMVLKMEKFEGFEDELSSEKGEYKATGTSGSRDVFADEFDSADLD